MKRRVLLSLIVSALTAAALASPAAADFALKDLGLSFEEEGGGAAMQAGAHPFALTTALGFETTTVEDIPFEVPDGSAKDLTIALPPGLAGNPTATVRCTTLEFLQEACSPGSQVGTTDVTLSDPSKTETYPVYNLTPPPGVAAKLGFLAEEVVPVTIEVGVAPTPPYNILAGLSNIPQVIPFYSAVTRILGVPDKVPFLTSPRACEGPLPTFFEATSWEGGASNGTVLTEPGFSGCEKLGFSPEIEAKATSRAASAPTGFDFTLEIEDEGLQNPDGLADSDIKKIALTLPEGVTANPSLAEGLATCSPAGYAAEAVDSEPGEGCPQAAKIGSLEVETPLLEDKVLQGQIFIATQGDNPFNSLLALYLVIKDKELGIIVKAAGRVSPDPETGRLTATFGEPGHELPQFPLSSVRTHLREGARSPLITPSLCGTYETEALLTPWAAPSQPLEASASFEIDQGVNGGSCPSGGTPPFEPGFNGGTLNNQAGSHSTFAMQITRRDGDQDLTKLSATLPPGLVAKLAGTGFCPESAIATARAKTGKAEQASPSCPADSRIGSVLAGAGVGSQLVYAPGAVYLSGPHNGAPLSVIGIVPAVAGPFDVGTVVVRQALRVNPRSGIVTVDGAASDPIPHILAGIPLRVREIRVSVDKPNFTLNPTSCDQMSIGAELWGGGADLFSAADDSPVARSSRFQAADCANLGFKPQLQLRLRGGTKRGGHPALKGTFKPRASDANLKGLVLRLPRSAFLDQAHIRTICTRVQFASGGGNGAGCPAGAIYGKAVAYTPILDQPLTGPVYLRSSDNNLPDFVAALHGLVEVEAVARIDSVRGGIRATFEDVPDAPLSKVEVSMQGAKKGLIVNSTDLCAGKQRANAQMSAQNGRRANGRPLVKASCGKGREAKRAQKRQRR